MTRHWSDAPPAKAGLHSITSSARSSSDRGIARPSAFAVLRLITSSNLVGCCDRQVGRLRALEDAVDVADRAPEQVDRVGSIGNQAAVLRMIAVRIDSRQGMAGGQRNDRRAVGRRRAARGHDQAAIGGAREGRDGVFDLASVADVGRLQLDSGRGRRARITSQWASRKGSTAIAQDASRAQRGARSP